MNAKSGWNSQILSTAKFCRTACFPDTPHAILLAEYANAAPFLMSLSVLRAAGWPLTLCLICFWLQTCATTTAWLSAGGGPVTVCGCALVHTDLPREGHSEWETQMGAKTLLLCRSGASLQPLRHSSASRTALRLQQLIGENGSRVQSPVGVGHESSLLLQVGRWPLLVQLRNT